MALSDEQQAAGLTPEMYNAIQGLFDQGIEPLCTGLLKVIKGESKIVINTVPYEKIINGDDGSGGTTFKLALGYRHEITVEPV